MSTPTIYNIPAGLPFAKHLASYVLETYGHDPASLCAVTILLPTRRACRIIRDAFLEQSRGAALMLPKLQALGDIDEEELALSSPHGDITLNLKPAIAPLRRQILLARLIQAHPSFDQNFDQALLLAKALSHFIDQIHTENLDMADLATLVPEDFADHWQITLQFLEILSHQWPKILEEEGAMDVAQRRNALLLALNALWQDSPPQCPVIAAGTTGSIPATAAILKTVAELENGQIILPGFDTHIDDESWEALEETHPQYGFKHLLRTIDAPKSAIQDLPGSHNTEQQTPRQKLCTELMRPASTANTWSEISPDIAKGFENLELYTCQHEIEEAEVIAILLLEALQHKDKTACLITPDRTLAQRVQIYAQRWGIDLDDSAGTPLSQMPEGAFLRLITSCVAEKFSPGSVLALLKHPLCAIDNIEAMDLALRGSKPAQSLEGLKLHIEHNKDIASEQTEQALQTLEALEKTFQPFIELRDSERAHFSKWINAHLRTAEHIAQKKIWFGEAGEHASTLFSDLLGQADIMPETTIATYHDIHTNLMRGATVRKTYGTTPRLRILGQLEARLIDADLVIMSGLNEGTWPAEPTADPWMSRPMRKEFGLPLPERSIGLAAHDFAQSFCTPHVIMTRAEKLGGAPTVPARWLQRLDAVMLAAKLDGKEILHSHRAQHWAKALDHAGDPKPVSRPAPTPGPDQRPKRLSVTKIEEWLRDPYALYANKVLKLQALDQIETPIDAKIKGTLLHAILEDFMAAHPKELPNNAQQKLCAIAQKHVKRRSENPEDWHIWLKRFEKIAAFFVAQEQQRRKERIFTHISELKGEWVINHEQAKLTLSGIADRIDLDALGHAQLIDYKSGGQFTKKSLSAGEYPQLPLEALMLQQKAFPNIHPETVSALEYWMLNGSGQGGKITRCTNDEIDMQELIENTQQNLMTLIESFSQKETPYLSLPRPDKVPRFNDYLHLARVQEWSVLGDEDTSEAA